ncbi:MAG: mechanosensitive ion channel family protein [Anaerolineae bacterium]|nr:mechanosensitive ion channel family protein [Anaerolineae bacterium]
MEHSVLLATLALLLVWGLRKLLAAIVVSPLRRAAERSQKRWDDILLDSIIVPARVLIIALGFALGAEILQLDDITRTFVYHLIRTLVVIALFMAGIRAVDVIAPSSVRLFGVTGLNISERLLPFLRTVIKLLFIVLAVLVSVQEWGYDASGLITGLGVGGLAISLAAQDTIRNLFGFTTIVGDQPFTVGDFIKTNDVEGTVEHVGVRSTRIRQMDQAFVTVPNSVLANSAILNWSRLSKRWINMTLRITYDAQRGDMQALLEQLRDMLKSREHVDSDSVLVSFINFGDAGMEILIRCYVTLADWAAFTSEREHINLEMMKIIEDLGLHIAFPARAVYIDTNKPSVPAPANAGANNSGQGASQATEEKK